VNAPSSAVPPSDSGRLDASAAHYRGEAGQLDADFVNHYTELLQRPWCAGARALQLGLGNGALARQLAARFTDFTIVEGSPELVRTFVPPAGCRVVESFFETFTPAAPVDRIFGNHVLEHVDDPVAVLHRTRDWLTPDGRALFTVPNAGSLHRRIGVELGLLKKPDDLNDQDVRLGHRRVYHATTFRADLEAAGYTVETLHGYMLKVVSNRQMKGWPRDLLDAGYRVSLTLPAEFCANLFAVCRR